MKVTKSHGAIAACPEAWPQCRPSPAARPVSCSRPTPPSHPSCSMDKQTNQSEASLCSAALRRLPTLCTIRLSSAFSSSVFSYLLLHSGLSGLLIAFVRLLNINLLSYCFHVYKGPIFSILYSSSDLLYSFYIFFF